MEICTLQMLSYSSFTCGFEFSFVYHFEFNCALFYFEEFLSSCVLFTLPSFLSPRWFVPPVSQYLALSYVFNGTCTYNMASILLNHSFANLWTQITTFSAFWAPINTGIQNAPPCLRASLTHVAPVQTQLEEHINNVSGQTRQGVRREDNNIFGTTCRL